MEDGVAARIPFAARREAVHMEVVKATSDRALLEGVILPLVKQEKIWEHYPAILHGLWAAVWSSFFLGLCRILEFREDRKRGSLANLLRRIQSGEDPTDNLPRRWEAKRTEFQDAIPARLDRIREADGRLAMLRSGYLAHLDMTKVGHPDLNVPLDELKTFLVFATEVLTDYYLAFQDESHTFEPSNFHHEPQQFLTWCRLDDYATHHAARVSEERKAALKRYGIDNK